jgi:uncharacterized protein (TIGR03118 family)
MPVWINTRRKFSHSQRRVTRGRTLAIETLERRCMMDAAGFVETNLVSDIKGVARHTDHDLVNPWDFSQTPDGQFRISANSAGNSPLVTADGEVLGKPVVIPAPAGSPPGSLSSPNGNVANTTSDFVISSNGRSAPAKVLFSTEDGTISGWNPLVSKHQAVIGADESSNGAVYKLLATGSANGNNYLYATNFHSGTIDVFDKNFKLVHLDGPFTDPNMAPPAPNQSGFAPFGVKNINGTLFVAYALQKPGQHDDQEGAGNGFIDEFDTSGHFIMRFASGTAVGGALTELNSPISMIVAPSNFGPGGKFSGALLVGNFGDSHVSAFKLSNGEFLGQLSDAQGHPLTLNGGVGGSDTKGLWGIAFGNGHGGADTHTLFFAAGINDESDGLFGNVAMTDGDHDHDDISGKQGHDMAHEAGLDALLLGEGANSRSSGAHTMIAGLHEISVARAEITSALSTPTLIPAAPMMQLLSSGLTKAASRKLAAVHRVFNDLATFDELNDTLKV